MWNGPSTVAGVAGEEAVEVAADQLPGGVSVVADEEPDGGVKDVVQAGRDEHAVGETVDAATGHCVARHGFTHFTLDLLVVPVAAPVSAVLVAGWADAGA